MTDAAVNELRPNLSPQSEDAIEVWNTMAGWFPERLMVVLELLGTTHIDGLVERLLVIRQFVSERDG